jgi:hypothetical protein
MNPGGTKEILGAGK